MLLALGLLLFPARPIQKDLCLCREAINRFKGQRRLQLLLHRVPHIQSASHDVIQFFRLEHGLLLLV
jgi:hypothetical protein